MQGLKERLKILLPAPLTRFLIGLRYGWYGNYSSWEVAKRKCTGYDSIPILEQVKESTGRVQRGLAKYERDSVIFKEVQYSYPLLSGLLWIAAKNKGKLHVMDYGGALGSSYYQNKSFLDTLADVKWCIVEQTHFVQTGKEDFSKGKLQFYDSIESCIQSNQIDLVLLSSVLQYLESPYKLLEEIQSSKIENVIIDRTPYVMGPDRLTIQKVNPQIYPARYPCWFFNKTRFLDFMNSNYDMILEFDALDRANILSEFKGFIFKRKQS